MSHVGSTICHHEKKKKRKKENLQGSEQNVVRVKEIAQGKIPSMLFRMDPNGLPIRSSRLYFCLVSHPLPG